MDNIVYAHPVENEPNKNSIYVYILCTLFILSTIKVPEMSRSGITDNVIKPNMTIIDVINNDTIVQIIEPFVNGYSHYNNIEGISEEICNIDYLRENMYLSTYTEEKCGKSYKKDNIMVKLPEAMYCDKGNIHNSISNIHERFDISPNISIIKIDNYIECNEIEFNRIFNICNIEVLLYYILEIFKAYDEKRLPKIHPHTLYKTGLYTEVLSLFNFYNSF